MSGTHREGRDTNPPRREPDDKRSLYDLRQYDSAEMTAQRITQSKESTMNFEYATPAVSELETFMNPFPAGMSGVVHIEAPEFTSLCPKTGLPDFANIVVDYIPNRLCLESKSYKLYLVGFRQHGAFHESCVTTIYKDLKKLLDPAYLKVEGRFSPRGGISFWPSLESTAEDTLENHSAVELPTLTPLTPDESDESKPCLYWCASRIGLDCNCRNTDGSFKPDHSRQD